MKPYIHGFNQSSLTFSGLFIVYIVSFVKIFKKKITALTYGLGGAAHIVLILSSCFSGQNKNQYVIGYLMWRVLSGRNRSIEYHMQIPGHARCLVDSGFASIKKLYRYIKFI